MTIDGGLTVVIPTKGRPTIKRALESLHYSKQDNQLKYYNYDVVVVYDGYGELKGDYYTELEVTKLCEGLGVPVRFEVHDAGYNDWGYPQLAYAYENLHLDNKLFVCNIGDDDVMVEGAIPRILDIVDANGIHPYMFQAMLYPSPNRGNIEPTLLWNDEDRTLTRQHITGQNLIVPNIPCMMGTMVDDCEFIIQTINEWGGLVQWVPIVTVNCY